MQTVLSTQDYRQACKTANITDDLTHIPLKWMQTQLYIAHGSGDVAQLFSVGSSTLLKQVWLPGVARDFSPSQLSLQNFWQCSFSSCVQSDAWISVRMLKIPRVGSHTIVWTDGNTKAHEVNPRRWNAAAQVEGELKMVTWKMGDLHKKSGMRKNRNVFQVL